jgi:hypothetical protein
LSFGEKRNPEPALSIGFRRLEMTTFGILKSNVDARNGLIFLIQHVATDRTAPVGRSCEAAEGKQDAQGTDQKRRSFHEGVLSSR